MLGIISLFVIVVSVLLLQALWTEGGVGELGGISTHVTPSQFAMRGPLLSAAELNFYQVLRVAVPETVVVMSKVRVADIVMPTGRKNTREWWANFNAISGKHVDFLLCDGKTWMPIAVVELDDKSHLAPSVLEKDMAKDIRIESAGLKVIRFTCQAAYGVEEIRNALMASVSFRWDSKR